ncbi:MAG: hypothetical protein GOMPHAMPRED_006141 [Gomphillus americanus]|uniref:histone acetyltransferase n=1 Tax=Gomphillus americanus TaxID=1940652 RepID=A0A8H3I5R6_9LECA|nr:MAG: hypothetical protein GOMPHAMPRED_006141 [Gomphillus americanus]
MPASTTLPSLHSLLANALPRSVQLIIHHAISEKSTCSGLFSAPPGELPDSTTSESHLLSVSIKHKDQPLQVFALEIYIYETDSLTTIFVSKADSTGYLHLLNLPTGTLSPIRTITTTFLDWLVETKRRPNTRLLLSLFARAQNQYLFPGSIENSGKHVLNDRELIRWWCKVLDPVLLRHIASEPFSNQQAHAHLVVPGLDSYETRSYFPKSQSYSLGEKPRWSATDPLQNLGKSNGLPPRCYIPRFPDDPKARFALDLDDELPDQPENIDAEKGRYPGIWRSAKSLAQFWELMSFRQECSAGRLVGFVWIVFEPEIDHTTSQNIGTVNEAGGLSTSILPSSQGQESIVSVTTNLPSSPPLLSSQDDPPSPITSPQPQRKGDSDGQAKQQESEQIAPAKDHSMRGHQKNSGLRLDEATYKSVLLTLDSLDYANLEVALESTAKFLRTISDVANTKDDWGIDIIGTESLETENFSVIPVTTPTTDSNLISNDSVNIISASLVRKKKRAVEETSAPPAEVKEPETRILSGGLVRKKPKV